VLLALSLSLAMYEHKRLQHTAKPMLWIASSLIVATVLSVTHLLREQHSVKGYRVLSDVESNYGWVRVIDQPYERVRWL